MNSSISDSVEGNPENMGKSRRNYHNVTGVKKITVFINFILFTCQKMLAKYKVYMFYIYIVIITINAISNIMFFFSLGAFEGDILSSLNNCFYNNNKGISESNLILKINPNKINWDLSTDLNNTESKVDSNNPGARPESELDTSGINKKNEYKMKNVNPLHDIHQRLLHADKSHFPAQSDLKKNCLPKIPEETPVYGKKLVFNQPSSLLKNRNLPEMHIEIPKNTTTISKLAELQKALEGADEAINLYDTQAIKFRKILDNIKNGTEEFYPNEAKALMKTYLDLVAELSNQQKGMANEAINQLKKLDPNFSRNLYPIDSPKASGAETLLEKVSEIRKRS